MGRLRTKICTPLHDDEEGATSSAVAFTAETSVRARDSLSGRGDDNDVARCLARSAEKSPEYRNRTVRLSRLRRESKFGPVSALDAASALASFFRWTDSGSGLSGVRPPPPSPVEGDIMERVLVAANLLRPADAAPESGGDAKQLVVALGLLLLLLRATLDLPPPSFS